MSSWIPSPWRDVIIWMEVAGEGFKYLSKKASSRAFSSWLVGCGAGRPGTGVKPWPAFCTVMSSAGTPAF